MPSPDDAAARKLATQLKLRHLRLVLALKEARTITAAAEKLNVSPAAVSKALTEIEAVVGLSLLDRGARVLGLTEAGQCMAEHAQAVLSEVDRAAEAIASVGLGITGTLRLASTTVSAQPAVASAMVRFHQAHPKVLIQFTMESNVDLAIEQLMRRDIDLLFSYADQRLERQGLAVDTLIEEQKLFIVAARGHPLARPRARPTVRQIHAAAWCLPATTSRLRPHMEGMFRDAGLPIPDRGYVSSDLSMIINLMNEAGCLALVPDRVRRKLVEQNLAACLAFDTGRKAERVEMVWYAAPQLRAAARAFREELLAA